MGRDEPKEKIMKTDWSEIEPFRLTEGMMASSTGDPFGFFVFRFGNKQVRAMAADGQETGWEHVSVSVLIYDGKKGKSRMPTWDEMCFVKDKFWGEEETVVQFHPPKSEYVNNHHACLHLWKDVAGEQRIPPSILVGVKELGTISK